MTGTISFILPFLDADTVFVIFLIGFLFYELLRFLSSLKDEKEKDKEKMNNKEGILFKSGETEKLFWFAIFGIIIYGTATISSSTLAYFVLSENPISSIMLLNLKIPFFLEFFSLNNIINLLSTNESFFGNVVLIYPIFFIILPLFLYLLFLLELKISDTKIPYNLILPIYLILIITISSFSIFFTLGTKGILTLFQIIVIIFCSVLILIYLILTYLLNNKHLEEKKDGNLKEVSLKMFIIVLPIFLIDDLYYIPYFTTFFITLLAIRKIYSSEDKDKVFYSIGVIYLIFMMAFSLYGFIHIIPTVHSGIYNIQNVSNSGYFVSGYIFSENKSNLSFNDTIIFRGTVNFTHPYNYTYIPILNRSNFSALP